MTTKKKQKKDWLSLTYILPWAIGGVLFVPGLMIYFAFNIKTFDKLTYDWLLNITMIFLLLKTPIVDTEWINELQDAGFIKKKGRKNVKR